LHTSTRAAVVVFDGLVDAPSDLSAAIARVRAWLNGGPNHAGMNDLRTIVAAAERAAAQPIRWMVVRDSHDPDEYFETESEARANACLGLADARVRPLYASPPAQAEPQPEAPPAFHIDKSVPPIVLQVTPGASPPPEAGDDGVQWFCPHCNPCEGRGDAKCRQPRPCAGCTTPSVCREDGCAVVALDGEPPADALVEDESIADMLTRHDKEVRAAIRRTHDRMIGAEAKRDAVERQMQTFNVVVQERDAKIVAAVERADRAEAALAEAEGREKALREALAELVACKDLK
jgi:hypothetical protein